MVSPVSTGDIYLAPGCIRVNTIPSVADHVSPNENALDNMPLVNQNLDTWPTRYLRVTYTQYPGTPVLTRYHPWQTMYLGMENILHIVMIVTFI